MTKLNFHSHLKTGDKIIKTDTYKGKKYRHQNRFILVQKIKNKPVKYCEKIVKIKLHQLCVYFPINLKRSYH